MRNPREIYGSGIRFPLVATPGFAWVEGEDAVAQALRAVLLTAPGERIARPSYGAGLRRFLFMPNNPTTRTQIRQSVIEAIERDEPRALLNDVVVSADAADPTLLHIAVDYRLPGDVTPQGFVFPFYLEQGGT